MSLLLRTYFSNFLAQCLLQASPVFTFANQTGLDMLETTLVALQDIMLDKTLDESGRKALCSEFPKIMQQVFFHLLDDSFAIFLKKKSLSDLES